MGIKISDLNEYNNPTGEDFFPIVDVKNLGTRKIKFADILKLIFPIGSTYVTQTEENPNTILGFGTWERIKGKVCLGLDEEDSNLSKIGNTGGEKEHTLNIWEIPEHYHDVQSGNVINTTSGGYGVANNFNKSGAQMTTSAAGGNQAHNNMQPYEVVGYMWIRRA